MISSTMNTDIDDQFSTTSSSLTCFQVGNKKVKLTVEVQDSDEEFDEWFLDSVPGKIGVHPRSFWVHPVNATRPTNGEYVRVCLPIRKHADKFFKYFRMNVSTYDYILHHIEEDLTKHSIRPSISAGERLAVTLRYLSAGTSFESLAGTFFMDSYTVGLIVREVCDVIYRRFVSKHMAVPNPEDFLKIAADYGRLWNFPNCIGALDGKHIRIKRPRKSGSMFFNYKLFYSIVLQAVVDANYRFIFVDVGAFGKQSDGGVFAASSLSSFVADANNFPPPRSIKGLSLVLPYLFVCDDAYPLKTNMMKPYAGNRLSKEQDIFNGRLSRARRCVECAFGILANKWRLLLQTIDTSEEKAESIVKCLTVLHNIIIDKEGVDQRVLDAVRQKLGETELGNVRAGRRYNRSAGTALAVRDALMAYFNSSAGAVPWQERYIKS